MKYLLVITLISITVLGCKKRAYKVDKNFVGFWSASTSPSDTYSISIEERRGYDIYSGSWGEEYEKTARINRKKDILIIGDLQVHIDQYPTLHLASIYKPCHLENWTMILEGIEFSACK